VGAIVEEESVVVVDTMVPRVPLVAVAVGGGFLVVTVVVLTDLGCALFACNRANALLVAAGLGRVAVCLLVPGFDAVGFLVMWLPLILDAVLTLVPISDNVVVINIAETMFVSLIVC
jgi:hypothetical protein